MASGSIITICNRSLGAAASRAMIQSLNEGSAEAIACNLYFQSTYESLARAAQWGCLKKQDNLTLLLSAPGTQNNPQGLITPYPPNPWLYTYLIPPDSLYIQRLVPPPKLPPPGTTPVFPQGTFTQWGRFSRAPIPYEIGYRNDTNGNPCQVINTSLAAAEAIYIVNQPNPQFWDSSFQAAMVASLAAYLVTTLSLDKGLMQANIGIAKDLIAQAKMRDGNESPVSQAREAPWIAARGGSGPYFTGYNTPIGNYEMTWPC